MLKYSEFVPYATEGVGFTRINHSSSKCSGTSNSMRIERYDNGTITAHCFRCGASGKYRPAVSLVSDSRKSSLATRPERAYTCKGSSDSGLWPVEATIWIRGRGITQSEITEYGIFYDETLRRVVIPMMWNAEKIGYVTRKIYDDDPYPKYVMQCSKSVGWRSKLHIDKDEIVIVEDVLSAIKVGRQTNCIALLSTNVNDVILNYITTYKNYYVWLDNDNRIVINKSIKLLKRLKLFGTSKLIETSKDPKEYTDKEIEEILYGKRDPTYI